MIYSDTHKCRNACIVVVQAKRLLGFCITGMLSKSKDQSLRVAVALHVLFNWETPQSIPEEISNSAMKAAINFVDVSIQHAAYLAGRKDFREEIESSADVTRYNDVIIHT